MPCFREIAKISMQNPALIKEMENQNKQVKIHACVTFTTKKDLSTNDLK